MSVNNHHSNSCIQYIHLPGLTDDVRPFGTNLISSIVCNTHIESVLLCNAL